jgi:hypothetical protein
MMIPDMTAMVAAQHTIDLQRRAAEARLAQAAGVSPAQHRERPSTVPAQPRRFPLRALSALRFRRPKPAVRGAASLAR